MSRNLLSHETSPYLLLHKDNPVHWRPWGPDALAEAEASNKPILLSIGYTACHWCHVMNEESFSDQATADIINENFIPIKVDREERPDIDQVYQSAITAFGTQGGWPLTMFLMPTGGPFAGGTYFPKEERTGATSFKTALVNVATLYSQQSDSAAASAETIRQRLGELWGRNQRGDLGQFNFAQVAVRIGQRYDVFFGGMQGTPKFPHMGQIEALFRAYLRHSMPQFHLLYSTALQQISLGGIYDHVGGGIARYATDEMWLTPHFEKMLYDNAQYIEMLTLAWQLDRHPLYAIRIEETAEWVLRDMRSGGAFASSIDADSEGEEGKYYLWSEAEIDVALTGTFAQKFKQIYGVTAQGNHKGKNILHRLAPGSQFGISEADEVLLKKQRAILLEVRDKRVAPLRDDKVQADWNGMMISALANAGATFKKTAWTAAAIQAFDFVERSMSDGDLLFHSWRNGRRYHAGFAEDYAHMARAALTLWQATDDNRYLERARKWVHTLNSHFWDHQNGGYFQTADFSDPLIARVRSAVDQIIPCANGIMPAVLARLYFATADNMYRSSSNALVEAFSGELSTAYLGMTTFINSFETVVNGMQIVIVGSIASPRTHELINAVLGRALPNKLIMRIDPKDILPPRHPAYGKTMVDGQATAYICQQQSCSQPVTSPVELSQRLMPATERAAGQPMGIPVGSA